MSRKPKAPLVVCPDRATPPGPPSPRRPCPPPSEIVQELDRQITKTIRALGETVRPDTDGFLYVAEAVERLERAREVYRRFGHRLTSLSKGAELAE